MRIAVPTTLVLLLVFFAQVDAVAAQHQSVVKDGDYVGLEKMPNLTPEERAARWFHENTLVIRNDEAILDKVPVTIRHGKKEYSASDGGFLTYRAKFETKNGQNVVWLRLFKSDYIIFAVGKHDQYTEVKTYPVTFVSDEIEFGGVRYKLSKVESWKLNSLLPLLSTEPLEKHESEPDSVSILVDSVAVLAVADQAELRKKVETLERNGCNGKYGYLEPTTVSDYVSGKVKAIRVLRSAPLSNANRFTADELRQKASEVWQGKFRTVSCQPMWAEPAFWSIDAAVEFQDGKTSPLITDGVHVALQDHDGNSAFFRLFPAAQ